LLKVYRSRTEGTCWVKATGTRPKIIVTAGGRGVVGHAGARLLADVAQAVGLTGACSDALAGLRQRRGVHDPGRVVVDLAVMLADGGEAICDLAVLRDQAQLFGPVASDPTAWRLLSDLDEAMLAELRVARAAARELAWAQRIDTRGGLPQTTAAGQPVPGLVLDLDASIVLCHSEKESATATWKKTFGYHPLFCFLDNTREALSGMLREGRAGSNTTADHITVLDQALAQIPDAHRHGTPILIRSDSAGCTHDLLAHIRGLRGQGMDTRFSVGVAITEPIRRAILSAKQHGQWLPALDSDGDPRDGAQICELTGLVPEEGSRPGPGSSCAANARTPARNCRYSTPSKACVTRSWPPTPHPDRARSSTWKPGTAATPEWRTGSVVERTPASAGSPPACSRSTPPGSSSP
jgi:hypothetical protein